MQAAVDGIVWDGFDPLRTLPVPTHVVQADPSCGAVLLDDDVVAFRAANAHAVITRVDGAAHSIHSGPTLDAYLVELDTFLDTLVDAR